MIKLTLVCVSGLQVASNLAAQLYAIRLLGLTSAHDSFLVLQGFYLAVTLTLGNSFFNYWLPILIQSNSNELEFRSNVNLARNTLLQRGLLPGFYILIPVVVTLYFATPLFDLSPGQFFILNTLFLATTCASSLTYIELCQLRATSRPLTAEVVQLSAGILFLGAVALFSSCFSLPIYALFLAGKSLFIGLALKAITRVPFLHIEVASMPSDLKSIMVPNFFVRCILNLDRVILSLLAPGLVVIWGLLSQCIALGNTLVDKTLNSWALPRLLQKRRLGARAMLRTFFTKTARYSAFFLVAPLSAIPLTGFSALAFVFILKIPDQQAATIAETIPLCLATVIVANLGTYCSAMMIGLSYHKLAGAINLLMALLVLGVKVALIPVLSMQILLICNVVQIFITASLYLLWMQRSSTEA